MKRGGPLLFTLASVVLAASAGAACGQQASPAGPGDTCEQATDCQEGYVCITQPDGSRQCSDNLSSIQTTEEAGMDAEAQGDAPAAQDGSAPAPDGTAPADSGGGSPDTGGGGTKDSGTPPQDTGSPPQDTGSPPQDTGSPPADSGSGDASGD